MRGIKSDFSGRRFGRLTALEASEKSADGHFIWLCKCDCGNYVKVRSNNLTSGTTTSCGCSSLRLANERAGMKFGKLTALRRVGVRSKRAVWEFRCDCGNTIKADGSDVFTGKRTSCGCDRKYHRTHGQSDTRLYAIWFDMRRRCNQPQNKSYPRYGAKGIRVCEEWESSFQNFMVWSYENGYSDDKTIDRIDNSKGYYPENCRWVDLITQANNKSNNHKFIFNGKELTIAEAAREYGVNYGTLKSKINRGANESDALLDLIGRKNASRNETI